MTNSEILLNYLKNDLIELEDTHVFDDITFDRITCEKDFVLNNLEDEDFWSEIRIEFIFHNDEFYDINCIEILTNNGSIESDDSDNGQLAKVIENFILNNHIL